MIINREQQQAVEYNRGPLLIIAGAGTGKTLVIVEKIKYLLKKKLARPEEILALTFTEKAASEMEERVDQALPYGYFQTTISTFHSFADQILREEIGHIGLSSDYHLMSQAETLIFLRENLFLFNLKYFSPLGNPNKFLEALLQHFSRLKDEDIGPDEYLQWAKFQITNNKSQITKEEAEKNLELAEAYKTYQELKIKKNYFDFSDLVYYLLLLFKKRKTLLKNYQTKYKYVLVDEFQDTNIAQYSLIKLLCPQEKKPKLTVVGDDSQAIYKFRGASVSNILSFRHDYPKAKRVMLNKNYRSAQNILDSAYRLIKNNDPDTLEAKLGISKKLASTKKTVESSEKTMEFYLAGLVEEEADWVAKNILKLKDKYRYVDIAILARANDHSHPFIRSFYRHGIPYQFLGPGILFKQPEIKDLIAYIFFLSDLDDSVSLYRVLTMDVFGIDEKDVSQLISFSKKISRSLFQGLEICLGFFEKTIYQPEFEIYKPYLPLIGGKSKKKLLLVYQMIKKHLTLIKKETAGQILFYFLEDSGYLGKLVSYKTENEEKTVLNISKFFDKLKNFEIRNEDASIFAVSDFIRMSLEIKESPTAAETDLTLYDAVNIMTVHSAKGLEFPVVFLVNLTKERFPTRQRKETIPIPDELIKETLPQGDYHLQEERRLFYVGLTRAMDKVFLSASQYYDEGKRIRKISPFVYEALDRSLIDRQLSVKKEEKNQLSIFDFKKQKEVIAGKLKPAQRFSYSQLETFATCPLQYKYQYLLRIPTTPSSVSSFGSTIHKTLQRFYRWFILEGKNKSVAFLERQLFGFYQKLWMPIGYSSLNHEQRTKEEGEKMLISFLTKFHRPDLNILALEQSFKIKISSDIYITGIIDRIDKINNNQIEIIDYKTGKKPADRELKKSLQLSIYTMAGADKGFLNKKITEINLVFYYLQTQEKVTLKRTAAEINEVKEKVKEVVTEIRKNEFPPNVGLHCDFCNFKMICEAWR